MNPVALSDLEAALNKYYPPQQPLFTNIPNHDPLLRALLALRLAAAGFEVEPSPRDLTAT